ncbi:MAG: glycosyltransferase [Anaerolineae bacterium]|nr:glycosyltransferase [Anaerolineae bacterium]
MLSMVYFVAALLVALYGVNALFLSVLYLRRGAPAAGSAAAEPAEPEEWPVVTVQLPIYNELHVVRRLLDAVARLDYPRDRLQIQVLDDSTDGTTRLARACVAHHRAQGLDVDLLHRVDRAGFKAGALAYGLARARGELIAVLDADFCPAADFLKRTVPHLLARADLAFVQARWSYLNADYSLLTRVQTIALDGHFVVEHIARNRHGLVMNFNGTAGVWRRAAIEDAGGWHSDTLTEDVDLSFRAQLAGWHALYLPDVPVPAELPPQMAAFKRQQGRWATGAAQCLVKLAPLLLHGRPAGTPGTPVLGWPARLEGLLHLGVWVAHPVSIALLFLTLPMLLGQIPLTLNLSIFWLVALGPLVAYALSQRHLYTDWRRRLPYALGLALVGTGLALSNTIAIARGLFRGDRVFQRTPKFDVMARGDRWADSRYALPFEWISVGELALAIFALATAAVAVGVRNYYAVPFLLLYVGGYGYVALHGLRDAWVSKQAGERRMRRPAPASSRMR